MRVLDFSIVGKNTDNYSKEFNVDRFLLYYDSERMRAALKRNIRLYVFFNLHCYRITHIMFILTCMSLIYKIDPNN